MAMTHYRCFSCGKDLIGLEFTDDGTPARAKVVEGVVLEFDDQDNVTGVCGTCGARTPVQMMKAFAIKLRQQRGQ